MEGVEDDDAETRPKYSKRDVMEIIREERKNFQEEVQDEIEEVVQQRERALLNEIKVLQQLEEKEKELQRLCTKLDDAKDKTREWGDKYRELKAKVEGVLHERQALYET